MALSSAQLQALKTHIQGDPALQGLPNTPDGHFEIALRLNLLAAPDFWVWRTSVSKTDYTNTTSSDGTNFIWAGNGFITRSAGEQAAWREMFDASGTVNPSLPNTRQGMADIFSGTGNAASNRTHLLAISRRRATVAEKVLATGTGSTASPATMTFEGNLLYQDVEAARNLP